MTERPILFSAPMVRALLAGTKTQTRRVLKPQPSPELLADYAEIRASRGCTRTDAQALTDCLPCPYGQSGDRLWVRESGWERPALSARDLRDGADTWPPYEFDAGPVCCWEEGELKRLGWKRRPSIHMPRWASRITLEVTGVRVERLQEISEADAQAEGIQYSERFNGYCIGEAEHFHSHDPRESFWSLWESINGPGSVQANPWVWVLEFRRLP